MSDIVERLREGSERYGGSPLMLEALREILRLRADVERLTAERDRKIWQLASARDAERNMREKAARIMEEPDQDDAEIPAAILQTRKLGRRIRARRIRALPLTEPDNG